MKLLKQPNRWSCLPTAFAMLLDITVEEVVVALGHDGSELIYPGHSEPYCRRSFHIQEMIDVCLLRNIGIVQIERAPVSEALGATYNVPVPKARMEFYLSKFPGVLIGVGSISGKPHAVAWNGSKIFDPNGTTYPLSNFKPDLFFVKIKFN